jgi:hypothetical protein
MRPVVGMSGFPSNLICRLVTLPGSSGPGSFEASEKLALSNVTLKSHFSFNGFLKSIPAGLAPTGHLIGPWG